MWKFQFTENDLMKFIDEASENCYLGEFKKAEVIERPGFFEMNYKSGDFEYRDSFVGFYLSTGQEIVRYKNQPIWSSNYAGGLIDKYVGDIDFFRKLEKFLITSLGKTDHSEKFSPRGPKEFVDGDWKYICKWEGDIKNFTGIEHIYFQNEDVFFHRFFGGVIIGKE